MPVKKLFEILIRAARCDGWRLSLPSRLMAAGLFFKMLLVNVTSSIVDHGAFPSWFRTVNRIAGPACASTQLFSKTLPSMITRRALFSSKRFLTDQCRPAELGSPCFQLNGLQNEFMAESP